MSLAQVPSLNNAKHFSFYFYCYDCGVHFPRTSRFAVTWETYHNYKRLFLYLLCKQHLESSSITNCSKVRHLITRSYFSAVKSRPKGALKGNSRDSIRVISQQNRIPDKL